MTSDRVAEERSYKTNALLLVVYGGGAIDAIGTVFDPPIVASAK